MPPRPGGVAIATIVSVSSNGTDLYYSKVGKSGSRKVGKLGGKKDPRFSEK
jgi:hypothetical protein